MGRFSEIPIAAGRLFGLSTFTHTDNFGAVVLMESRVGTAGSLDLVDGNPIDHTLLLGALQSMRNGEFSVRLPGHWTGLAGKIADAFNDLADANEQVASELTRVAETVGRHGHTRERVRCAHRIGAWGDIERAVNGLIEDLLWPTREVTRSIAAVAQGDLTRMVPLEIDGRVVEGEFLRSAQIVNRMIEQIRLFTSEVTCVARQVGAGVWQDLTDINSMSTALTAQVRNISEVTITAEQQTQQRELQKTNEELAQKARLLAAQNAEVERKNREIEQARRALEEKVAELALTSRYKSEFLANMSHELRTPLNSILVLSRQLVDNADSNLSEREIEYASTIHAAGTDLLNLISDILDLSKIESGTVTVECEELSLANLKHTLERTFAHEAQSSGLEFRAELHPELGDSIRTDPKRLLQVMKNLLSNAFKFTVEGSVHLNLRPAAEGWTPGHAVLDSADDVVAFEVADTGIGIPPDKQKMVFEAFQQADAGTARKHGGTGLGLAISRELAQLLGGEIKLVSSPGEGSTFTLYLPSVFAGPAVPAEAAAVRAAGRRPPMLAAARPAGSPIDDRETFSAGDRLLVTAHADPRIAEAIADAAHDAGLEILHANHGSELLALARQRSPAAISFDATLTDMHGWTLLSRLKHAPELRHIPVQWIGHGIDRLEARRRGARAALARPVEAADLHASLQQLVGDGTEPRRRLLVVEGDCAEPGRLADLAGGPDVETSVTVLARDALGLLRRHEFDCVLLDAEPRDLPAVDMLREASAEPALKNVPFVVYAPVPREEPFAAARRELVLRDAPTLESVLDETAMFLHRRAADLQIERRRLLESPFRDVLAGKTVLVIDDDAPNIFALTGLLERHRVEVVAAGSGAEALRLLDELATLSLVLLDIMMPEMDGYETIRRMRQHPRFSQPIIALTAKAMAGDREKCLEAGASDYIAKPIDSEQFLALLRVWLDR